MRFNLTKFAVKPEEIHCGNNSHHQHCKTKLPKLLALINCYFVQCIHICYEDNYTSWKKGESCLCKHVQTHGVPHAPLWSITPVVTTAAQGSVLCLILFLPDPVLINKLDDGTMCILSKLVEGAKLGRMTDRPQGWHSPSDLERKKKQAHRSFMKFNKLKHKVLPLGGNNPRHQHMLGPPLWKAALQKGTWGQKVERGPSLCCLNKC